RRDRGRWGSGRGRSRRCRRVGQRGRGQHHRRQNDGGSTDREPEIERAKQHVVSSRRDASKPLRGASSCSSVSMISETWGYACCQAWGVGIPVVRLGSSATVQPVFLSRRGYWAPDESALDYSLGTVVCQVTAGS